MNEFFTPQRQRLARRLRAFDTNDPTLAQLMRWLVQATEMTLFGPGELQDVLRVLRVGGGCGWNALSFDVEGDEVEVTYVGEVLYLPVGSLRGALEALAVEPPPVDPPDLVSRLGAYAEAVVSGDAVAAENARRQLERGASVPETRAAWADTAAHIIASVSATPGGISAFAHALDRWAAGDADAGRTLDEIVRRWETEFAATTRSTEADAALHRRVRGSIRDAIIGRGFGAGRQRPGEDGSSSDSS